ncbi:MULTISPECIES: helix-turn-helix domain-containing protein [Aerococcus]|uniref:Helix-turn-helix transcriptional regulator n=5 Tax=Aerococcus TaxID=1375 RepID=A0A329NUY3_9LACT|nr:MULTISPECIES: helix-turn-helix transcriptional regulator [Aerococcus]AEA00856.1 DNA-binding helix-turn-helix protein [Aerococcus sp. Group 1]AMB96191.1 XRE family transcriptional regulator [Aerococcus urinae]KAA9218481.1 helix-turn-helix transcriptional regulator [Aerococcus loyolae]KAA9232217.1 helix-turn-helix transcriptional regulator [Aerococcus mictus]KAA9238784.1 helix-turn-helix transcriptional regulator [Aerococcus urinae]
MDTHREDLSLDEKNIARQQASIKASDVLLKIRQEKGLSQAQLADISGRKQSYISRVESRQQNISLGTLQEIVNAVGGHLVVDVHF